MSQPRVVVRGGGECIITPRHGWTAQPRPVILPPVRAWLSSHGEWDTGSELRTWVAPQPHWHTVRPRGASHWDLSAGWQYEEWWSSGWYWSAPSYSHWAAEGDVWQGQRGTLMEHHHHLSPLVIRNLANWNNFASRQRELAAGLECFYLDVLILWVDGRRQSINILDIDNQTVSYVTVWEDHNNISIPRH